MIIVPLGGVLYMIIVGVFYMIIVPLGGVLYLMMYL